MIAKTLQIGALFAFMCVGMAGCTDPEPSGETAGEAAATTEELQVMSEEAKAAPARTLIAAGDIEVLSDTTVSRFRFPESVAYDPEAGALYVSEFVSALKPTQMDGQGRISRVSLDGILEQRQFLPAEGQTLNKPKGIWVAGDRLWVTDIDSLWVFDTGNRRGRKVLLPESEFANDVTVSGDVAYVSDDRGDRLYRVTPADFLKPNGVYAAPKDWLLLGGFKSPEEPRGLYARDPQGELRIFARELGRVDGIHLLENGAVLLTEWDAGALGIWDGDSGYRELASGFEGPADFAVVPNNDGWLVVVPDLVRSELRLIQLGRRDSDAG